MRVSFILIRLVVLVQNPLRLILTRNALLNFVFIILLCLTSNIVVAQNNQAPIPVKEEETNFQCDIVMDIYDAFYDWTTNTSWGGMGLPLLTVPKVTKGALCLANLNDTNGNGDVDWEDTDISANPKGRNEIDLMKLVIRPRDVSISLSGNIQLTSSTGGPPIKLWRTPNKALSTDLVVLPATINTNELPLTLYIEALEPSQTVRDIVLTASYGSKQDVVKATAYWVELVNTYGETSDDPDLGALGVGGCIISAITQNSVGSSSKFGFGKFFDNMKLGGRILFEWRVKPSDPLAYDLISIDGTRQRRTKNWSLDMKVPNFVGPDCKFVLNEMKFPFNDNMDNELPNDDSFKPNACIDENIAANGNFFTYDAPNIRLNEESGASPLYRAFVDDKTNFLEYIRMAPKGYNFNPSFTGSGKVLGSRASDKIEWANARYTRKNDQFYLDLDNTEYGFNHVRINLEDDHDNYPFNYTNSSLSQQNLGTYFASFFETLEGDYDLLLTRISADLNGNCNILDEEHDVTVPNQSNFSFPFDNHTLNLQLLEPFGIPVITFFWHTFQSINKANKLEKDTHLDNLNH